MSSFLNAVLDTWTNLNPELKGEIKRNVQAKVPKEVVQVGSVVSQIIRIANGQNDINNNGQDSNNVNNQQRNNQNNNQNNDYEEDDFIDVEFEEVEG